MAKRVDAVTKWAIGLVLWVSACWGCVHPRVPMQWRPDTRELAGVHLDSMPFHRTLEILQSALPNETSVCYFGRFRDTVLVDVPATIISIDSVSESHHDSTSQYHVFYSHLGAGCPANILAVGHSHPYVPPQDLCTHSDDDAMVMFENPKILVSIVWCGDGRAEVMWQDGRRSLRRWREP